MLVQLESKQEIATAQGKLEATLQRAFSKHVTKAIGYPGGHTDEADVFTDGRYWYRCADSDADGESNPRRLNWFGRFQDATYLAITVEINTPYEGRNDRISGFFARDPDTNTVYLMHSGRVGGGRKGVGKHALMAWCRESLLTPVMDASGKWRDGVVVMPVEGPAATRSVIRYVELVAGFKQAVREGETETPAFRQRQQEYNRYYAESWGRRTGRRKAIVDYLSRHGEIVDALNAWRQNRPSASEARIVKNIWIDLGVAVGETLVEVYEVKTGTSRYDLYTAIGQLLVHAGSAECQRILVVPDQAPIPEDVTATLQRLSIRLLRFQLDATRARIL